MAATVPQATAAPATPKSTPPVTVAAIIVRLMGGRSGLLAQEQSMDAMRAVPIVLEKILDFMNMPGNPIETAL